MWLPASYAFEKLVGSVNVKWYSLGRTEAQFFSSTESFSLSLRCHLAGLMYHKIRITPPPPPAFCSPPLISVFLQSSSSPLCLFIFPAIVSWMGNTKVLSIPPPHLLRSQWSPRVFSAFKGRKREGRRRSGAFKSPLIDTEFIASKEQPERRREEKASGDRRQEGEMKENGRMDGSDERVSLHCSAAAANATPLLSFSLPLIYKYSSTLGNVPIPLPRMLKKWHRCLLRKRLFRDQRPRSRTYCPDSLLGPIIFSS